MLPESSSLTVLRACMIFPGGIALKPIALTFTSQIWHTSIDRRWEASNPTELLPGTLDLLILRTLAQDECTATA